MKKEIFIFLLTVIFLYSLLFIINAQDITGSTVTGELIEANLAISISVLGPPILTIIKPENETYLTTKNLLLDYSARGADFVWYNFDNTPPNKTITTPIYFNTIEGGHTLYLYANNSDGNLTVRNVTFTVNSSKFRMRYGKWTRSNKGSSTNFNLSSYEDIQNLSGIILEHTQAGKILFNEAINLTDDEDPTDNQIDISSYINISNNRIEINTTGLPNFNKSATLYFYNLTLDSPVRILRDGSVCPAIICTQQSYISGALIFNVTQFSIYSAESVPTTPETPPGGGGGVSARKDFSLSTDEIKTTLKQGETLTKSIIITNDGRKRLNFVIENPTLKYFLKISETSFELNSGESKTIILNFSVRDDSFPNLYVGKIIIKADGIEKEILIAVEVESADGLFDVEVEIPRRYLKIAPGEEILAEIKLYNLGSTEKIDVMVEYIIKDENNNVVTTKSETIAVETRTSFIETVLIPKNTEYGRHLFYVRVTYDSKVASASTFFEVTVPGISKKEKLYIISIIFLILLLSGMVYYLIRYKTKSRRKIVKKINIKDILKR